jgi:chromatin remodeling complex protein RSC6
MIQVEEYKKKTKKKKTKKNVSEKSSENVDTTENVDTVDTTENVNTVDTTETQPVEKESRIKKHKINDEYISNYFDELVESINEEVKNIKESPTKKNIKFLKSLNKRIKILKKSNTTLLKQKQKEKKKRKNNTNSGFLKPVPISNELANFTGWGETELKSRVDVTKYICNYIKENNLQNPKDRRQIKPDKKLRKLLKYPKNSDEPLKYYSLQTHLKPHFT